jgi:hypothetical protein
MPPRAFTTGGAWPDGERAPLGSVIMLSVEKPPPIQFAGIEKQPKASAAACTLSGASRLTTASGAW